MKTKLADYKKWILPIGLIFIFATISSITLMMQGDDFVWYFMYDLEELSEWTTPNGRYFTNAITYLMVKNAFIRNIIYIVALSSLIILISGLSDFNKKSVTLKYAFVFSFLLLMPSEIYSEVINWVSGFTNYILSTLLTLLYVLYCFKLIFQKDFIPNKFMFIINFVLGFAGALCVEHITVYNILFGIGILFLIYKFRQKVFLSNITYVISTIIGAVLMFSSNKYSDIFYETDSIGMRHVEFELSDIFMQMYRRIIPNYSKQFFIIHLFIVVLLMALYYRADKTNWDTSRSRYAKFSIVICIIYMTYSLFVNFFEDLIIFDFSMKIRAIETALTFLYFVSLLYLSFVLLNRERSIRTMIYFVSTVIITLPFVVVNPVTPRCFFVDYIFWILAVGEIFFECYERFEFVQSLQMKTVFSIFAIVIGCFICNINISNKYYSNVRLEYIKEQLDNKNKIVEIIKLPYSDYCYDDLNDNDDLFANSFFDGYSYDDLFFIYYGIDIDKDNFEYTLISVLDYNTAKGTT